jgi:hypothetical protein
MSEGINIVIENPDTSSSRRLGREIDLQQGMGTGGGKLPSSWTSN